MTRLPAVFLHGAGVAGPSHIVAHSYGSIAAALLAARRPDLVASLVLAEPALLHLSRDEPHTRQHIDDLAPARSGRAQPSLACHGTTVDLRGRAGLRRGGADGFTAALAEHWRLVEQDQPART